MNSKNYQLPLQVGASGLLSLSMRWVIGWTYFSAFWRRVVLENKLDPNIAGYVGEKFNHFLPNALGIKPLIEYLVMNPHDLQLAMILFTIVEAIVGLFMILGLFTRLMSVGVFGLAFGILLGSGWLGTTCLDEWQIGILGLAGGFTLFLTGSDVYSLDHYFMQRKRKFTSTGWFRWIGSGPLPLKYMKTFILSFSLFILGIALFTNQSFHGGVWGTLHNKSVKPKIEISNVRLNSSDLTFQVYRSEGVDVYGSFLIGIQIIGSNGQIIKSWNTDELSAFPLGRIKNKYVTKVKPGKHSLIIPLGAKADLAIDIKGLHLSNNDTLKLIDISGIEWTAKIP